MRIRSVTMLGDPRSWSTMDLKDSMERWATIVLETSRRLSRAGLDVWTTRLVLPGLPDDDPSFIGRVVSAVPDGFMVALGHTRRPEVLVEASRHGLYSYALLESLDRAKAFASAFIDVSMRRPEDATKIAVSAGGHIVNTPYFPMSSSRPREKSLSVSLLYPSDIKGYWGRGGLEALTTRLEELFSKVEEVLPEAAIDYSLSPWMEESVAEIVEEISGSRIPGPGNMGAVHLLSRAIRRAAGIRATGFNEVMLPVEEDLRLKELAKSGSIRAGDLIALTVSCLVGLDMAVVNAGEGDVTNLLLDARAASLAAGKPIGVRLIPVQEPPGSTIDLGRFGRAAVIRP